ncbi:MAG: alpha/beta hydrolase [Prevotella sp.]|nr:alpha/beta hydrolase [Prevotella sp.]
MHLRIKTSLLLLPLLLAACSTYRSGYVAVSGGGRLYYEEKGEGEPLLLLHGHSLDRRMWDKQFTPFARHYRTIRLDFRGYGRSSDQDEQLPMTHVDDVITLMDSLRIDQAHVVGLSMGAFTAGDMLAMYPGRMKSCVLASGSIRRGSPPPSEPMDSAERARRDVEIAALIEKGVDVMKHEWLEQLISSGGSQRERMRKPLWRMISDWTAWQPLHKEVRLFYGREAWDSLCSRRPSVPVLMLTGETEHKNYRPRELDYLPNGRHLILPDCGHMMNMEQPDSFNRAVLQFIGQTDNHQ